MIRITDIQTAGTETGARLSAHVQHAGMGLETSEVWIGYPLEYLDHLACSADPWIAMFLWPAMKLGQDLHVEAPASDLLLQSTRTLMDIMHCWDASYQPVSVTASGVTRDQAAAAAVASFFSGGVDSFYTAVKHTAADAPARSRLTHLISIEGFDVKFADDVLWRQVAGHLRASAAELRCSWVECATNVRKIVPGTLIRWGMYYGAVLASVGLGLKGLWNTVMIPAAQSYADLYPGGSHPVMDPLWSTESVRIANNGAEATRIRKVARIAQCDTALGHLRVCWENRWGQYNCGECEKCLRTMINLQVAGVLPKFRTFNRPLDYREIRRIALASPAQRSLMLQNYQAAAESGSDPQLIRALKQCVAPGLPSRIWSAPLRYGKQIARGADRLVLGGRARQWYRQRRH